MPRFSYSAIMSLPLATDFSVSKERQASTSVDTRPGTSAANSAPIATVNVSVTCSGVWPVFLPVSISAATNSSVAGSVNAFRTSDGFVVQSTGLYSLTAAASPVSATTTVISLSCSKTVFMFNFLTFSFGYFVIV